jgi:radical SAM superfamily enzyme YgiQ (UPF0313 family)
MLSSILLISCYELGHQPAGITIPAGFLRAAGYDVDTLDLSVQQFDPAMVSRASFAGISVPMHTALRMGVPVAREIKRLNPHCHVCFHGLYASLNASYLLDTVADSVLGGESEEVLTELVEALSKRTSLDQVDGVSTKSNRKTPVLKRLRFVAPYRETLPGLSAYAKLQFEGEERLAGYVEASRGCLHHCTHCPIPPVYGGRFFVVPQDVVLEDIRGLVAAGARHVTFGDPDFLNGPGHSLRIIRAMRQEFPELTFDFTAKVEHILKHRGLFPELGRSGCLFVVSAVESLSDHVLARLDKGHVKADIIEALRIVREAEIALRPSFVSFTPWTTLDDFIEMLEFIDSEHLIDHVDPVQYSIRLLVPPGSLLLSSADSIECVGPLSRDNFTYEWRHPDPRMDELHQSVSAVVEEAASSGEDSLVTFERVRELANAMSGRPRRVTKHQRLRARPPRLTESWFCCAEPTRSQLVSLKRTPG